MHKKDSNKNPNKSNCKTCNYYKKKMCVHSSPNCNKPFGFPFLYNPNEIHCSSWKKETLDKYVTWEHM